MRSASALVVAIVLGAAVARAGMDLELRSGEKVTGSLDAGGDAETFRLALPEGAVVSVKAKAAKGGTPLRVRFLDPSAAAVREATGPKPSLAGLAAAATGVHAVEVSAADGTSAGGYSLAVKWSVPKSASAVVTVAAGGSSVLAFAGDAGTKATFAVKPGKGSAAVAQLVELRAPGAVVTPLGPAAKGSAVLAAFGAHELVFGDGGAAGGALAASVKLAPPKVVKRKLDLTGASVPLGTAVLGAATISKLGGGLAAPAGAIEGASVAVPAGALKKTVTIFIGTGPGIVPDDGTFDAAGPCVFFGPEGITFATGSPATVTLPFDGSVFAGDASTLRVYTRDAAGVISEIEPTTIDLVTGRVTFPTSHFSTFQVFRSKGAVLRARLSHSPDLGGEEPVPNRFGGSVLLTERWLAVSARRDGQSLSGSVHVHPFDDGTIGTRVRLEPFDVQETDNFASSIAISGDVLVVGCQGRRSVPPSTANNPGSVFVYRFTGSTWQIEQELFASAGVSFGRFGAAVAIDGTRIAVGAPTDDEGTAGSAYVFAFDGSTWTQEALFESGLTSEFDAFGRSVAISGTTLAVGAANRDPDTFRSPGFLRVFARDAGTGTWSPIADLHGETTTSDLGACVALSGSLLVAGAPRQAPEGRAFVYEILGATVTELAELTGAGPLNSSFGASCAFDGQDLVIGADGVPVDDAPGKAYVFARNGNGYDRTATVRGQDVDLARYETGLPTIGVLTPRLGGSVALSGKWLLVGAPDSKGGPAFDQAAAGSALLFELE